MRGSMRRALMLAENEGCCKEARSLTFFNNAIGASVLALGVLTILALSESSMMTRMMTKKTIMRKNYMIGICGARGARVDDSLDGAVAARW